MQGPDELFAMCGSFGDSFEKLVAEAVAADGLKGRGVGAEFCDWEGFWSAEWFSLYLTRTGGLTLRRLCTWFCRGRERRVFARGDGEEVCCSY